MRPIDYVEAFTATPGPFSEILEAIVSGSDAWLRGDAEFKELQPVKRLLALSREEQHDALLAVFQEIGLFHDRYRKRVEQVNDRAAREILLPLCSSAACLLKRNHKLSQDEWARVLGDIAKYKYIVVDYEHVYTKLLLTQLERNAERWISLSQPLREAMIVVSKRIGTTSSNAPHQKAAERFATILRRFEAKAEFLSRPPEEWHAWTEAALREAASTLDPQLTSLPAFPSTRGDPLHEAYAIAQAFCGEAMAQIDRFPLDIRKVNATQTAMAFEPRSHILIAAIRWSVWLRVIGRSVAAFVEGYPHVRDTSHLMTHFVERLAQKRSDLTEAQVADIVQLGDPARHHGRCWVPDAAMINLLWHHSRKHALSGEACQQITRLYESLCRRMLVLSGREQERLTMLRGTVSASASTLPTPSSTSPGDPRQTAAFLLDNYITTLAQRPLMTQRPGEDPRPTTLDDILATTPDMQQEVLREALVMLEWLRTPEHPPPPPRWDKWHLECVPHHIIESLCLAILHRQPPLCDELLLMLGDAVLHPYGGSLNAEGIIPFAILLERTLARSEPTVDLRQMAARLGEAMARRRQPSEQRLAELLTSYASGLDPQRPSTHHRSANLPESDAATRKRHAALLDALHEVGRLGEWAYPEFRERPEMQAILGLPDAERSTMLLRLFDELGSAAARVKDDSEDGLDWLNFHEHTRAHVSVMAIQWMLERPLGLDEAEWARILGNLARYRILWMWPFQTHLPATFEALSRDADAWTSIAPETAALIEKVGSSICGITYEKSHMMLNEKLRSVLQRFTGGTSKETKTPGLPALPAASPTTRTEITFLLSQLAREVVDMEVFRGHVFGGCPSFATLCALPADRFPELLRQATERHEVLVGPDGMMNTGGWSTNPGCRERLALLEIIATHLPKAVEGKPHVINYLCAWVASQQNWATAFDRVEDGLLRAVEKHAKAQDVMPAMAAWVTIARERWTKYPKTYASKIKRSGPLLNDELIIDLDPGEPWAAQALTDVNGAAPAARAAWTHLIDHCMGASGSAPSAKWAARATDLIKAIGKRDFEAAILRWLPLTSEARTTVATTGYLQLPIGSIMLLDRSMSTLRGLSWAVALAPTPTNAPDIARALGKLVISAYRKIPQRGPRAILVGNAAIHALGQMKGPDALGQLAMLRVKVKFGTGQKMLEKALVAAATREGLPRDEIEELAVPSYGMTDVGLRREEIGEFIAELRIEPGGSLELTFTKMAVDAKGKPAKAQRSVPAVIKSDFADDLKELKAAAKDIASMLPAQRDRIDSLFVDNKSWPLATWRERYLDHPLVGTIARRLIWTFTPAPGAKAAPTAHAAWLDERASLVTVGGEPFTPAEGTTVSLWHPINHATDDILAWRRFFEDRQIRQPFKQAHREVYILTDAERNTNTYSNRYAAHIIRQHQFNALCAARHWKNKLRLMVDAEYPPATRHLRAFGLRAEFWIEGAGDDYGVHTNEAGTFHFLATDQVRFYNEGAAQGIAHASGGGAYVRDRAAPGNPVNEPLSLDQIPPLAFSEIMRDVDLFVGVGSIGNNPQWADGGPTNEHRDYWWHFSFGEMSESGRTRRDILSRLVPRLKIASVCTLAEQFLIVKGKLRTYKIHLGSGNILMEPNDQYLCIVPSSREEALGTASGGPGVFLPFEGDRTLSIILSKAFMLAADDTIADPSIRSQIARK